MCDDGFSMHSPDDAEQGEGNWIDIEIEPDVVTMTDDELRGMKAFLESSMNIVCGLQAIPVYVVAYALAYLRHNPQIEGLIKEGSDDAFGYFLYIIRDINEGAAEAMMKIDRSFEEQSQAQEGE